MFPLAGAALTEHLVYSAPSIDLTQLDLGTAYVAARTHRTSFGEVVCKIANTRSEREDAFRLVYDAYVRRGLMEPNPYGMRVTNYHLLSTTDVFVAVHREKVIYTLTRITDDALGLPADSIYESEFARLRGKGVCLAEISCLASRDGYFSQNKMFDVFVNLVALLFQSARASGVEQLVIAVHPRHGRFYQRLLGFRQIGELRSYESVRGNPAVALAHNFSRLDRAPYRLYDRIYGTTFHGWELLPQPISAVDRNYFAGISEVCDPCFPIVA